MKKLALALTATAAFTGQAIAADMAVKARPAPLPVVVPVNWTGCYIAGGGGGGWQVNDNNLYIGTPAAPLSSNKTDGLHGWFGTVQGGCDYQAGNFVIGAFADYDFSDINGDHLGFAFN
jgi:outer membrane immunogenic protein